MLDRTKVAQELERVSGSLFKERKSIAWLTKDIWQQIVDDSSFIKRVEHARKNQSLALWQDSLNIIKQMKKGLPAYSVIAVDGSQIYPDHHVQGTDCFLVNAAGCFLSYKTSGMAQFFSEPQVFVPEYFLSIFPYFSIDLVDLVREEKEFNLMVAHAPQLQKMNSDRPLLALFDGNLLFWHLQAKPSHVRDFFVQKYCDKLEQLYQERVLVAGYLSASQFRDLVDICKAGLPGVIDLNEALRGQLLQQLETMTDVDLLEYVLAPYERTTILSSTIDITALYPAALKPYFFYLHVGTEIVRIEIPAWIAADETMVDTICDICLDQCTKGYGYPVALAEAHGHAVVKGADRDFFYHMIYKQAVSQNKRIMLSQKSLKKRLMSI
jgi:hypothetical protein